VAEWAFGSGQDIGAEVGFLSAQKCNRDHIFYILSGK
jgi:hypothetical protein